MAKNVYADVLTKRVRFGYAHLFKKTDSGKYEIDLLIDKDDKTTVQRIKDAIAKIKKTSSLDLSRADSPVKDGDGKRAQGGDWYEACHGKFVLKCSTQNRPKVVDENGMECDEDTPVAGMHGVANVTFHDYEYQGRKGISCYINGIKLKPGNDDAALGNARDARTMFNDEDEDEDDLM